MDNGQAKQKGTIFGTFFHGF